MKRIASEFGNHEIRVWSKTKHIYVGHFEGTWLPQIYDEISNIQTLEWVYKRNNIPFRYLKIHEFLKTDSGIRVKFETDKVAAQKINVDFIDENRKLNCGLCLLNLQKVQNSVPNNQLDRPSNGIIPAAATPGPSRNIIGANQHPADSVRSTGSYDELAAIQNHVQSEIGPPATPGKSWQEAPTPMPNSSDSSSDEEEEEDENENALKLPKNSRNGIKRFKT